MIADRDDYYSM